MLEFFKKAFLFNLEGINRVIDFLESTVLLRLLLHYRFVLTIALYFIVMYGQEFWPAGSIERENFYYIGFALFRFLLILSILYRSVRVMNLFSVIVLFVFDVYLAFEVYNEAFCQGTSVLWQEALFTSLALMIVGVLGFVVLDSKDLEE